jgi:hypothetical protein
LNDMTKSRLARIAFKQAHRHAGILGGMATSEGEEGGKGKEASGEHEEVGVMMRGEESKGFSDAIDTSSARR